MRTTIVVEDGAAVGTSASRPPESQAAPMDAGPAAGAARGSAGLDAGAPPSWLVDEIAARGGVISPGSPDGVDRFVRDGGGAPRR